MRINSNIQIRSSIQMSINSNIEMSTNRNLSSVTGDCLPNKIYINLKIPGSPPGQGNKKITYNDAQW